MSCGHPGESEKTVEDIGNWLIEVQVDDFDCTVITTYSGTPYYDLAVPHTSEANVWTYTHPKTGDRLHSREADYRMCADYYKVDPNGGYRSFVFTDFLTAEQLVVLRDKVEREVREKLQIPFNAAAAAVRCEHSMEQGLRHFIHRMSKTEGFWDTIMPEKVAAV
jgi:anaerobic magnesium-protoporphyrin IX monomethyl ester cyclase